MFQDKPYIKAMERNGDGFFELHWSYLKKADKYSITTGIPSVSGLYELYYQDKEKVMNLLTIGIAWLGGLRSQIREDIDPLKKSEEIQKILDERTLFCRYSESPKADDIQDVAFFLSQMYFGKDSVIKDSGRYKKIYVKESAPDQLHWI